MLGTGPRTSGINVYHPAIRRIVISLLLLAPSGDFHPSFDGFGDLVDPVDAHLPLHRAAAPSCEYLTVVCAIINEQRVNK